MHLPDPMIQHILAFDSTNVIGNCFKNCGDFVLAMKIRQLRTGSSEDILLTKDQLTVSIQKTLANLIPLLRQLHFLHFSHIKDGTTRATLPYPPTYYGFRLCERERMCTCKDDSNLNLLQPAEVVMEAINSPTHKFSLQQLLRICDWIIELRNELKSLANRLSQALPVDDKDEELLRLIFDLWGTSNNRYAESRLHKRKRV